MIKGSATTRTVHWPKLVCPSDRSRNTCPKRSQRLYSPRVGSQRRNLVRVNDSRAGDWWHHPADPALDGLGRPRRGSSGCCLQVDDDR
jgi:hypothetical protein